MKTVNWEAVTVAVALGTAGISGWVSVKVDIANLHGDVSNLQTGQTEDSLKISKLYDILLPAHIAGSNSP